MSIPTSQSKRAFWWGWILFLATFPAGMAVGWLFARGQDAAGRGIGIGMGMLGVGLFGGIVGAIIVSRSAVRLLPDFSGKVLARLPWVILAIFWWMALFTPTGDRLAEWLERL